MLTIYHHPRCSKSRAALTLVQQFADQHMLTLNIVDYLQTPLSTDQLADLHQTLQSEHAVSVRDMMRTNEEIYSEL